MHNNYLSNLSITFTDIVEIIFINLYDTKFNFLLYLTYLN